MDFVQIFQFMRDILSFGFAPGSWLVGGYNTAGWFDHPWHLEERRQLSTESAGGKCPWLHFLVTDHCGIYSRKNAAARLARCPWRPNGRFRRLVDAGSIFFDRCGTYSNAESRGTL